ncbi:MAG: hypothetical protein AAF268_14055 [Cyanobacteria bacterium P01_A01_bin.3]
MAVVGVPPRPRPRTATQAPQPVARKLRHILVVTDKQGRRAISLEAALLSVGRASDNAIVLESDTAADLHALLVRVPDTSTPGGYRYRVVSGNDSGFHGTPPIVVNGMKCASHDLLSGDRLWLGNDAKVSYHVAALTDAELAAHVRPASFRRVKSAPAKPPVAQSKPLPTAALTMSDLMANFSKNETLFR